MKRIIKFFGLISLLLIFSGCNPSPETNKKGVIAYTPLTLSNPFFKLIGDNIKSEAEKNGYETIMVDPDMDVKKQSDQFDDFISQEVTAIILVPCDRLSIGPAVKAANEKGIPVFTVDAKCAAEGVIIAGHVGTDNFQGGKIAGKAMIQAIRSKFPNLSNTANTIRLKIRLGFRDLTLLNFDVELNEMCCSDRCLIFRFHVASLGGAVLTAMSQTLRGGNLEQKEKPPRSMSPPGQVFHLSVYSDRRRR